MGVEYFIPFGLFFMIIGIGMFIVNKMTKSKMKAIEKFLGITCIVISILIAIQGTNTLINNRNESLKNTYYGYVYLLEGSTEKAAQYFDKELNFNGYESLVLYGKSRVDMIKGNYDKSRGTLKKALDQTKDRELEKTIEKDLEKLENIQNIGANDIEQDTIDSVNKVIKVLNKKNKGEIDKIDRYISIEQKLDSNQDIHRIEDALKTMIEEDDRNLQAKKLLAKTYVQNGKYKKAYQEIKEVTSKEKNLSNLILLSDIVAESYYNNVPLIDGDDREIERFDKEIEKIDEEIKKIGKDNFLKTIIKKNDSNERLEKLEAMKRDIEKKKQEVIINRTINYLKATISISNESSIIKNLQIAKLYYVLGENEKSKTLIDNIKSKTNSILAVDTPTTKAVQEYNEHLSESREEKNEKIIKEIVEEVISNTNSELTDAMKDSEMNKGWENFLVAYAKYSSIPVVITKIETYNYPNIISYANIGGKKKGWFYFNKTFNNSDFNIADTTKEITDFEVKKVKESNTNICMIIDKSGSMKGRALEDAKNASIEFVRNIGRNHRVGVISFSDDIDMLSDLSRDRDSLEAKIDSIYDGGGTRLYDAALEGINKVKDEDGRKVVVLLTDGNDTDSYADAVEVMESANSNEVIIYTIGLGDVQTDILNQIASKTRGQFYKAPNSAELSMIYEEILQKISNTYEFNYTITENDTEKERYSKITLLKNKGVDIKNYTIGNNTDTEVVEVSSVNTDETAQEPMEEIPEYEFIPADNVENKLLFQSLEVSQIIKASNKSQSIIINENSFSKGKLKIMVGKYEIDETKTEVLNDNKVKATLPKDIEVGKYTIYGENELGEKTSLENALTITIPSKAVEIYLGNMTIRADSISQTESGYSARGNIVINDFIYIDNIIDIDTKGEHNAQHKYYSGNINGNGKMYVKFNPNSDNLLIKTFKWYEQVLDSNEFEIESRNSGSYIHKKNSLDARLMTPIMQWQPLGMKILEEKVEVTTAKFYLAGLDEESSKKVKNLTWFTRKVPMWTSTSEINIFINSKGCSLKGGEIWFEDMEIPVVPKIISLEKLILKVNLPEGVISARGNMDIGTIFPPKLSEELDLGLKFKLETKQYKLDNIELQLGITLPIYEPYLYLESLGGGIENIAETSSIMDCRLKLLASCSAFKIEDIPILGDIDVLEFNRLELNTILASKEFGFKGKAKFLTTDIADLKFQLNKTNKKALKDGADDTTTFLLEGNTYIDYEILSYKFNLNTGLEMTLISKKNKKNDTSFHSCANGDLDLKGLLWELEGASVNEITANSEYVQYNIEVNNGKDNVSLLLRLNSKKDKPIWNIADRIVFEIDF